MKLAAYPEGIFSVLQGIAEGVGEKLGKLGAAISESFEGHGRGGHASASAGHDSGGFFSGIKDALTRDKSHEIHHSREPEHAIAVTPAHHNPHHVDMAELGGFSPQSFGSAGASRTVGRC